MGHPKKAKGSERAYRGLEFEGKGCEITKRSVENKDITKL